MAGAVFLDRDGVLNAPVIRDGRPYPPRIPDEVAILPGVRDAIDTFRQAGLMTIVVTNQPDLARGGAEADGIGLINHIVADATGVDLVIVCPHDDADGCTCRKPLPGMILSAAAEHGIDLECSVMVGDRWRDVEAGRAARLPTVFVDRGYDERDPDRPSLVVSELSEAVAWILTTTKAKPP
jgi:D-glycero-D-manno-heptose 1,7-bisphosphate phosphatase